MTTFTNIDQVLAQTFVGVFSADQVMFDIYAFVENESHSIADRAAALRHLGVHCFGFEGHDAGIGIPDQEFVDQYMLSR